MTTAQQTEVVTGGTATVADGVADYLGKVSPDGIFGLPGIHVLDLFDSLHRKGLPVHTAVNEQGLAYMAEGYSKVGKLPVVILSAGPGICNVLAGLISSNQDSAASVWLCPLIPAARQGRHAVHEWPAAATLRGAGLSVRVVDDSDLPAAIAAAAADARNGRPHPEVVIFDSGELANAWEGEVPAELTPSPAPAPDLAEVSQAAELLAAAERPVVIAGRGVISAGAEQELIAVAEALGAPVVTTFGGRGLIPDSHPLSAGLASFESASAAVRDSDATLVVATKLSEISTVGWTVAPEGAVVRIDIDPAAMPYNADPQVALVGDARIALGALLSELRSRLAAPATGREGIAGAEDWLAVPEERPPGTPLHPRLVTRALRARGGAGFLYSVDASATQFWIMEQGFGAEGSPFMVLPEVFAQMGFALPGAIGAARALGGSRQVVAFLGDGSTLTQLGELALLSDFPHPLLILVMNDSTYNALRVFQRSRFEGRLTSVALPKISYAEIARSVGLASRRVDAPEDLDAALDEALAAPGAFLLEVIVDGGEDLPQHQAIRVKAY